MFHMLMHYCKVFVYKLKFICSAVTDIVCAQHCTIKVNVSRVEWCLEYAC